MDLTTLSRTKSYLGQTTNNQDVMIAALISRASSSITNWTSRTFQRGVHTDERFNGNDSRVLILPDYPVISVEKVQVDGVIITESLDAIASGWQNDDKFLYLFGGFRFCKGIRNILISYTAGYSAEEIDFIPATPFTITPKTGNGGAAFAVADRGVIFVDTGLPLTLVGSSPAANQYSFADGVYTFAAADTGKHVAMMYDYVPGAVEQAAIELVSYMIKHRDTLGLKSKSLAGETIMYDNVIPSSVKDMIGSFRKLVPV